MKKAIYKITNDINNKIYIGQSKNPDHRGKEHIWRSQENDADNSLIHKAMKKYGIKHFKMSIIGWYDNYNEMEKYYIKQYNSLSPNGYNIALGGEEPPHSYGEKHHNSVYSNQLCDAIINDLLSRKYTQKQIENKYNVNQQLITSINRGITHRKNGISYPIIKTSKYHIPQKDFEDICYLLKNSQCTCSEIGQYFGYSTSAIKAVNAGRNHFSSNINYPIRNFRGKANSQSVETILANRSKKITDKSSEM